MSRWEEIQMKVNKDTSYTKLLYKTIEIELFYVRVHLYIVYKHNAYYTQYTAHT